MWRQKLSFHNGLLNFKCVPPRIASKLHCKHSPIVTFTRLLSGFGGILKSPETGIYNSKFTRFGSEIKSGSHNDSLNFISDEIPNSISSTNDMKNDTNTFKLETNGRKWEKLTEHETGALLEAFVVQSSNLSPLEVSDFVYQLGMASASWESIPIETKKVIQSVCTTQCPNMSAVEVCNMITGFSQMGCVWKFNSLSEDLLNVIQHSVYTNKLSERPEQVVVDTLFALGQLGMHWSQLIKNTSRKEVQTALNIHLVWMHPINVIKVLFARQAMNLEWFHATPEFQTAVFNALYRVFGSDYPYSTVEVTKVLYILRSMDVPWGDITPKLQAILTKAIVNKVRDMDEYNICNCRYSMALMAFDAPINDNLTTIYTALSDVESSLYWRPMSISQTSIFYELLNTIQPTQHISDILHLFKSHNLKQIEDTNNTRLSKQHNNNYDNDNNSTIPKQHDEVSSSLNELLKTRSENYTIKNEFFGLKSGVYPIDCAVYKGSDLVALLEIDGLHHYTMRQTLRRSDKLKQYLYTHNYKNILFLRKHNHNIGKQGEILTGYKLANKIADAICATDIHQAELDLWLSQEMPRWCDYIIDWYTRTGKAFHFDFLFQYYLNDVPLPTHLDRRKTFIAIKHYLRVDSRFVSETNIDGKWLLHVVGSDKSQQTRVKQNIATTEDTTNHWKGKLPSQKAPRREKGSERGSDEEVEVGDDSSVYKPPKGMTRSDFAERDRQAAERDAATPPRRAGFGLSSARARGTNGVVLDSNRYREVRGRSQVGGGQQGPAGRGIDRDDNNGNRGDSRSGNRGGDRSGGENRSDGERRRNENDDEDRSRPIVTERDQRRRSLDSGRDERDAERPARATRAVLITSQVVKREWKAQEKREPEKIARKDNKHRD